MIKRLASVVFFSSAFSGGGWAHEYSRFTGDFGAGFTQGVGRTGDNLNTGWNIQGGFGVNFSRYLGAKVGLGFNRFDLSDSALFNAGVPGGNVKIFSATLDPFVHLNPNGRFDPYLVLGGGEYRFQDDL